MKLIARALLAALLAYPGAVSAIVCRVSVGPFNFGNYTPGDPAPLDVTGQMEVRCTGTAGVFTATLSAGSSGSFAERQMLSGPYVLRYNLYLDAARTVIWGDGTGGSQTGGALARPGREDFTLPVYGRVPPLQAVGAGAYRDDVVVTIVF